MLQHIPVLFAKNPTNTDLLSEFIKKLDDLLAEEAVEIINGPASPMAQLYNITASISSVERQLTRDEVLDLFRDIKEDELPEEKRIIKIKILAAKNKKDLDKIELPIMLVYEKRIPSGLIENEEEVKQQLVALEKMADTIQTTDSFIHASPKSHSSHKKVSILSVESIREYYKQYGEIIIKRKKCTCDSMGAVAFTLGSKVLEEVPRFNGIEIAICSFRNWTHTLLRISHTNTNGITKNLFYDPWYQRTYAATAKIPKVFSCEQLSKEMDFLVKKAASGIRYNDNLYDSNKKQTVSNAEQDYAYYVLCSTREFKNPSPVVADLSRANFLDVESTIFPRICPRIGCNIL